MNNRKWAMCSGRVDFKGHENLRKIAVDRKTETDMCINALIHRKENVLFYGDRGVGKTFFIRCILQNTLEETDDSLLVFPFNVTEINSYDPNDSGAAFTRAILTTLCSYIWIVLMGQSYTDLRESLSSPPNELSLSTPEAKLLKRIYHQLMLVERKALFESNNAIGVSVGISGKRNEKHQLSSRQNDLLPFEFFAFLDEIRTKILPSLGKKRIVVLCDEANVLTWQHQVGILERHIDLFSDGRVQFLFVVATQPLDERLNIPTNFETRFHMKGLSPGHIHEILCKIENPPSVTFSRDAVELICKSFENNTRFVLNAAERAERLSIEKGAFEVSHEDLMNAISRLEKENREFEIMRQSAPNQANAADAESHTAD